MNVKKWNEKQNQENKKKIKNRRKKQKEYNIYKYIIQMNNKTGNTSQFIAYSFILDVRGSVCV